LKKSKWSLVSIIVIVLALITVFGIHSDSFSIRPVQASALDVIPKPAYVGATIVQPLIDNNYSTASELFSEQRYFARYTGILGESAGLPGEVLDMVHLNWIDVISIHWGGRNASAGGGGASGGRATGRPVLDDFELTFLYDRSEPKLEEACLKGKVIPKLEVELYETFTGSDGTLVTNRYLRYEFKNVIITSFDVSGKIESGQRPTATITNAFEDVMVNYYYYGTSGEPEVSYSWNVTRVR
jgi:type VI secretion system secreted protein Hcp